MAKFDNINIGGKNFKSFQEAAEYKRQHPEWNGIGQIIDKVAAGETVTYSEKRSQKENNDEISQQPEMHLNPLNIINYNGEFQKRNIVIRNNGSVTINRGGKSYELRGSTLENIDGKWYRDGNPVDWNELGGEYEEKNVVSIIINGDVQELTTRSGDVTVNGDVNVVKTGSGDVSCNNAIKVSTGSGDVSCNSITGSVSTGSGDIYHKR